MMSLVSAVPWVTSGGCPGAIIAVTVVFHLPTQSAMALWCSPGVMNLVQASIMAFSSADISCAAGAAPAFAVGLVAGLSAASASWLAARVAVAVRMSRLLQVVTFISSPSFVGGP